MMSDSNQLPHRPMIELSTKVDFFFGAYTQNQVATEWQHPRLNYLKAHSLEEYVEQRSANKQGYFFGGQAKK